MCLKGVVYAEARGEPRLGQEAVAHVVLNRSINSGTEVCSTVRKKRQFRQAPPPQSFEVSIAGPDPTGGATYFRNYPGRWGHRRFLKQIGKHYFYG